MFPIRDHNPSGRTPVVVYLLMAANIALFLGYAQLLPDPRAINGFYAAWAMIPARLSHGEGSLTILTSMFLHGGLMHLAGNMLFLWIFGDNIEDVMGPVRFLGFYLACGVAAAGAQYLSDPYSQVPMVGASGAIAGVMGAYLLLFPKARVDVLIIFIVFFRILPIPAFLMLALWFAMQFVGGIGSDPAAGGVAYWAHAGGFLAGVVLAVPAWLAQGGPAFWRRTQGHPPHPEARYRVGKSNIPRAGRRSRSRIPKIRRR